MTDEMAIQGQRPSAMPYVLGGAAAGAGVGAIAGHMGLGATKAFSSWEDAVADVSKDDSFVKKQVEAKKGDAEAVKPWQTIKEQAEAKKTADDALKAITMPDGFEGKAELDAYMNKLSEVEKAEKAVADKYKAEYEKELGNLKNMKIEEGKPYNFNGVDYDEKAFKELLNSSKEEDQKLVKELVEATDGYKKATGGDFAKAEKTALDNAQRTLGEAETALKGKKGGEAVLEKSFMDKYKPAKEAAAKAKATAEKEVQDVLEKCKKPSYLIPAAVGALVLGLGGYLLRPSAPEEEIA